MSIGHHVKIILLATGISSATVVHAEVTTHPFEVESGMVLYEISGGAQLTPETNLSIKGNAKLRFKDWGDVKLEEEGGIVLTTGAIKHKQHVKRFEKQTKDTVITADFENEQLLERKKGANGIHDETASLVKKGQENVAGVLCDVWEGPGIKKCIYKNVVLKLESHVLDVSYVRVATQAVFDINTSNEACEVPDYPVQEFALFEDNLKTKNVYKAENFCKVLKDAAYEISEDTISYGTGTVTDKEREKFINHITKDIYERQKELLPELLNSLKETRACLQTGEDPFTANQCIEHFSRMKAKLGTEEDDYIILWDEKRKNVLLDKIEDELIYLQSRIPCVNRAHNITDLSACMK
ncbi:MAG: hypothetical protein HKP62_01595 [Sulfurovum sp.]|nr:hypothetical protein [Sulfurovum sp.]NNJ44689.1 hypothetical protein [Sulfurovum sp.]